MNRTVEENRTQSLIGIGEILGGIRALGFCVNRFHIDQKKKEFF